MDSFQGKVAVVTGAASGIGRALAERFYVLPHDDFDAQIRARTEAILARGNPAARP